MKDEIPLSGNAGNEPEKASAASGPAAAFQDEMKT